MQDTDYRYLPDEEYKKITSQVSTQLDAILDMFNCYGQQEEVKAAKGLCMRLTENAMQVVRGKEKPIQVVNSYQRRALDADN